MDDGVGNYVYYTKFRKSVYEAEVAAWHDSLLAVAFEALEADKWLSISDITYAYDWNLAEFANPGLAPAEAYAVVSYMAETYGLEKCVAVFQEVSHNGGSAEGGLASVLNLTFEKLEAAVEAWLTAQPF
jgi:hypothetical protein